MWVPGCVSGAGQTSTSPAHISHTISPSPLGCGHSLWRGFPHISLSTAPSQVLRRKLGRWPPPEGFMFSAGLAPTLSLISHVNQKSIREGSTAVVRPYLEALGFYKLWEHSYSLHKKKKKHKFYVFSPLDRTDTVAVHQYIFASKGSWMKGYVLSSGLLVVCASRWNTLPEAAEPSEKLGRGV